VRGRVRVDRRLGRGLILAAVLLVAATGWRSLRLASAWPGADAAVVAVDVEALEGGIRLEPDGRLRGAFSVRTLRGGRVDLLLPGASVVVGDARVALERGGPGDAEAEVLRRDWTVFGPPDRCGHRRVDFGADPLGRADGVRDRVVLPAVGGGAGWFHLVPAADGRDCFRFDDRGALLVAERPGLVLRTGERERALTVGEGVPVRRAFTVVSAEPEIRVRVSWESVSRARPVVAGGAVVGYRDEAGVDFVVRTARPGVGADRPPMVRLERGDEVLDRVVLAETRPTILFGRRDRVGPVRGRVLPSRAPNEELEAAVRSGLAEGWIAPAAGRTVVEVPEGMPTATARSLVGLMEDWDRARAPVGLRVDGLVAAAGTAEDRRGRVPLRRDVDLDAWVPSHRPFADGVVEFRLPVRPGVAAVDVEAAFPLAWSTGDVFTTLPAPPLGRWAAHRIDVDGDLLVLRLDARPPPEHRTERFAVALAGGPAGTELGEVRSGRRAFDGWESTSGAAASERAWDRAPGDRWSADVDAPAPSERARPGFVRVPVAADEAGWIALDLTLPGPARAARWNEAPLAHDRLPSAPEGETTRVSLKTVRGANLLTVRYEQLPTAPAREAGGVRFAVDDDGNVLGLDDRVADRRARPSVLGPVTPGEGTKLPGLLVESGVPGLERGTVWRPGPAAELVFPAGDEVVRNVYGVVERTDDGLRWRNGPSLALGVVRRVDDDPEGPPLAGYRVARSALQPLRADGDAIVGPVFRAELRAAAPREVEGALLVVADGRRRQLVVSGEPGWSAHEHPSIAVRSVAGRLQVRTTMQASLFTRVGERRDLDDDEWTAWPQGGRIAWMVPGGTLRLLHAGLPTPDVPGDTIESALQLAADSVLARVVGDRGLDDGDPLALRAAVLAMDAETGDILACGSLDRPNADPRTRASAPCWQDVGLHPGSTFKVGVATAALASGDPVVRRMIDGDLPVGLVRGGPRSELRGARLPPLPLLADSGPGRVLRSRLKNHRRRLMMTDATLEDALRSSLNTWFGYTGLLLHRPLREGWGAAGVADVERAREAWPVAGVAHAAGFGRRIDLGGGHVGTGGRFPTTAVEGDAPLAARAIGQGDVTATPLGVAALLAPVVADGWSPVPRLTLDRAPASRRVLTGPRAARLRAALHQVVLRGTAARAFSDHPQRHLLLGKTGSAQRVDGDGVSRTDAWFAGAVVPPSGAAGRPVVIVAVLPGGGLGGRTAAEVVDAFSRRLIVLRGWDAPPSS